MVEKRLLETWRDQLKERENERVQLNYLFIPWRDDKNKILRD